LLYKTQRVFIRAVLYGSCAWEIFGSAGFWE
jgi:hypothetical protein